MFSTIIFKKIMLNFKMDIKTWGINKRVKNKHQMSQGRNLVTSLHSACKEINYFYNFVLLFKGNMGIVLFGFG